MATVTYTITSRCAGGEHVSFDVAFNAGASTNYQFEVDGELRPALSQLTPEQRAQAAALILRIHTAGRTRAQLVAEFGTPASPIPVTVTI